MFYELPPKKLPRPETAHREKQGGHIINRRRTLVNPQPIKTQNSEKIANSLTSKNV
jgi:hypothetical protein